MNLTVRQYEALLAATVRALEEAERRYELLRGAHEALKRELERKGVQG